VIAVAVALLVASVLLGVYYVWDRPTQEGYMTLYVLDAQGQAVNYTETLRVGENMSVNVVVKNHLGTPIDSQVQVKVVKDLNPTFPLNGVNASETLFFNNLQDGEMQENTATVSMNEAGSYMVVFELWTKPANWDVNPGNVYPDFSGDYTVLNVQVTT